MRQRTFTRPVPIKTHLSVKAELREDKVPSLPLTPLTPRTELELRHACKTLVTAPAASPYSARPATSYQHVPSNAAQSFHQTTTQTFTSPTSPETDKAKETLRLAQKPVPAPPLAELSPVAFEFATTVTARKFSVVDLRAELERGNVVAATAASAAPTILRRPTIIDVNHGARPKTADIRARRQERNPALHVNHDKLALFPRPSTGCRPSTAGQTTKPFMMDLNERPLPPLPAEFMKPVQRSKSDSEVEIKGSRRLGMIGRKISSFFGRKGKEVAAAA